MFRNIFLMVVTAMLLAGCASGSGHGRAEYKPVQFHVSEVEVDVPAAMGQSPDFNWLLKNAATNAAWVYNSSMPDARAAYKMKVIVDEIHFKNPLTSLIIGDKNHIKYRVVLFDPVTNQVFRQSRVNYVDAASGMLNGISGMVLSMVVKKQAAEKNMIRHSMRDVFSKLYAMRRTPRNISLYLNKSDVFADRSGPITNLTAGSQVASAAQASEPKVINCQFC